MDALRFSSISHGQMRFWNPLPAGELVTVLRALPIVRGAQVLDYGCGVGEVAFELAAWHGARITGLDPNPDAIERCRGKVPGMFFVEEFRAARFETASFDLVVNIGASPGMERLLPQVLPLLRPSGRLLVGDLYWRRPPSEPLSSYLGLSSAPTLCEQRDAIAAGGFVVERELLASEADWDRYEDEYDANMLAYLARHPQDPSHASFENRRRVWREMYIEHGRGALGFALFQTRRVQ
jgi:SAM-dependent methyltransferase